MLLQKKIVKSLFVILLLWPFPHYSAAQNIPNPEKWKLETETLNSIDSAHSKDHTIYSKLDSSPIYIDEALEGIDNQQFILSDTFYKNATSKSRNHQGKQEHKEAKQNALINTKSNPENSPAFFDSKNIRNKNGLLILFGTGFLITLFLVLPRHFAKEAYSIYQIKDLLTSEKMESNNLGLFNSRGSLLKKKASEHENADELDRGKELNHIVISSKNKDISFDVDQLKYILAENEGTRFFFVDKNFFVVIAMKKVTNQLPKNKFIKVFRSIVVNVDFVETVSSKNVILNDGIRLPLSRTYKNEVKRIFTEAR